MKSTGIVRKLDVLGRIVIPIELRRTLNIEESDGLEIYVDHDRIILSKYKPSCACVFCGNADEEASSYKRKPVCKDCRDSIRKQVG